MKKKKQADQGIEEDDEAPEKKKSKKKEKDSGKKKKREEEKEEKDEEDDKVKYTKTLKSMARTPWNFMKEICHIERVKERQIRFFAGDNHFGAMKVEADYDSKSLKVEFFDSMWYVTDAYEKTVLFIKQQTEREGWHVVTECKSLCWQRQTIRWQKNQCSFFTAWTMDLLFQGIDPDTTNGPSKAKMKEMVEALQAKIIMTW